MNFTQSIHQIARIQYKNSKIFQLLRGHIPLTHPCARKRALGADAPPETYPILPPPPDN